MNGQLSDHPLAGLIHEISEAQLSGALRLAHERVKAVIYFEGGELVAALTNIRAYRLVEVVRRAGAVAEERLAGVVREGMTDEQAGIALVRSGALSPKELKKHQDRQAEEVLRSLLRWEGGEWEFAPRVRIAGEYRSRVSAAPLLAESARSLPAERLRALMSPESESVSPAPDLPARMEAGLQLLPTEAFVLTRVQGPMSLAELLAVSGQPEDETLRSVYVLALGGLLRREGQARAFSPEALARAQSQSQAPAAAAPPQRQKAAAEPAPEAAPAKEETPQEAATAPQQQAEPEPKPQPGAEQDPQAGMEELFERSRAATHYEVLGVTRSAKPDELKRAYYSLARRLHPDRFRRFADDAMRLQVDLAFAKIAQAYEVLSDSKLRASYDLKLQSAQRSAAARSAPKDMPRMKEERGGQAGTGRDAAGAPASPALSQESAALYRAEEKFQQGVAALQQGHEQLALKYLGEAALLAPKQARYRAHYGRALAREKQTRRQAEAELQAAVSLDERNAAYRVMLAELYAAIGLRRRAESELERALKLDPQHAGARRLLSELRRAG
ncbi:MAG TPA: DnaJ domain-containing protein [Pyrinomonadaceae bacterium]|nr:DnaJ domain-containing protein [Pyrinomonadaceae bacterium]